MNLDIVNGFTRIMGAPEGWDNAEVPVNALPVRDVMDGGVNWMVSAWKPTDEELAHLNANGKVQLWIMGNVHPVVGLNVDNGV